MAAGELYLQDLFQRDQRLRRFLLPNARPTGRKLGTGAYGTVEEVDVDGRVCAGKKIHDVLLQDRTPYITKFKEECQLMSDLRHPHLVRFLGICFLPPSRNPVLVMEKMHSSLDGLLTRHTRHPPLLPDIPLGLKRLFFVDTVRGLHFLHHHSPSPIIHRDLSAGNVLLTPSMVAKISDFGNARMINLQPDQLARLTRVPGTGVYMPPEAFPTPPCYGPALDIFSLGHLMLYTLIQVFPSDLLPVKYTDSPRGLPRQGRLLARSEVERRKHYITLLHQQLGAGHPLVQLVEQCLADQAEERPSAEEVLQRLEQMEIDVPYQNLTRLEMMRMTGCQVAKRVPRKDTGFHVPSGIVAAIDFGTTSCSLAYITISEEGPKQLPLNTTYYRVPTAILFTPDGSIDSFGYDAQILYFNLDDEECPKYAYFEQIEMDFQHDETVSREMRIKASNGTEYFLVDVIAQILNYLKNELEMNLRGILLGATDFDWVITVPAIWKARAKQMMREAGYKAGLCSDVFYGNLQPASQVSQTQPSERDPDKLTLALKPECAFIFCQNMPQRSAAPHCKAVHPFKASSFLVVDIGRRTFDISAHRISSSAGNLQVVHPPTGNDCGGTRVNKEFRKFLGKLVNDYYFSKYLNTGTSITNAKHIADLNHLVNDTFEKQKVMFGSRTSSSGKLSVQLPFTFMTTYSADIQRGLQQYDHSEVQLYGAVLRMSHAQMVKFMQPVVDRLLSCMAKTISDVEARIEAIYLVGGFSACQYIYTAISKRFGDDYRYIVPAEPTFAVVRGAVLYRRNPELVLGRKDFLSA